MSQQDRSFQEFFSLKEEFRFYYKFENKKNQIKVIAFKLNIIPRNIYANFLPMNAISGSSFTLIKFLIYFDKDSIIYQQNLSFKEEE